MDERMHFTLKAAGLLGSLGLMLGACQPPSGLSAADPSAAPSQAATTPAPSPTPSAGNVQPVITF